MMPDGWMEKTGGYAKDMTLRDYFAAKAMQSILINHPENVYNWVAQSAYALADEMLKAGQ